MLSENFLKCICLFTFIGLIAGNDAKTVRKNPFSARPYAWNDLACRGRPDGFHPHRNGCEWWLNCLGGSFVAEGSCSDGENFNHNNGQCNSIGSFDCFDNFENYYDDVGPIEPDSGCPPNGSNQLVFLESDYCEDFFICLNGQAIPQTCRDGLHWNVKDSICDFPENAGCEFDLPERMPTCSEPDFTGDLPHPTDCSLFVHCNNGNRSIQRCPHLLYFDRILGRCYIWSLAFCTSN